MADPNHKNQPKDDPSDAPESGDAATSGHTRGQVVGEKNPDTQDRSDGTGEQFESGRQDAAPRAGKQ